jgi:hypothetical protein
VTNNRKYNKIIKIKKINKNLNNLKSEELSKKKATKKKTEINNTKPVKEVIFLNGEILKILERK